MILILLSLLILSRSPPPRSNSQELQRGEQGIEEMRRGATTPFVLFPGTGTWWLRQRQGFWHNHAVRRLWTITPERSEGYSGS